jgi:hypothetical protein
MTSSQHGPYALGYTHATMDVNKGKQYREVEPIQKYVLSSDCSLQLDCMKSESLVTAGQLNCGEYVPGPCTHRPSRHLSCLHPKSMAQPLAEGVAEGVGSEGDEVVTR